MTTTDPKMPYGAAAARLALDPAEQQLPPLPIMPQAAPAAATTPPSPVPPPAPTMPTAGAQTSPAGPQAGGYPAPGAPKPFWQVKQQPGGGSIDYVLLPDGTEEILAVHPAPKIPRAFQQAPQPGMA